MIIFAEQLKAINALASAGPISTLELVPLPLRLRAVVTYKDGTHKTVNIDQDGVISESDFLATHPIRGTEYERK